MDDPENLLLQIISLPSDQMVGIIALAGISVAGFALHIVHSVIRREKEK